MANKSKGIEFLEEIMRSYRLSHVIFAAFEIGLFKSLTKRKKTISDLAEELQVSSRGLEMLMPALVALSILKREGNFYNVVKKFKAQLDPDSVDYIGGLINHEIHLSKRWPYLAESIRSGKPVKKSEMDNDSDRTRRFIRAMENIGQRSASIFIEKVPFRGDEQVLDLGGGPGKYLMKLCESYPGIQITLFDQPETIKMAQTHLATHPDYNRMRFIAGDIFNNTWGKIYDVILVSNVIHIFGEEEIQSLFLKCNHSMQKNGRLLIKDMIMNSNHNGPLFTTVFALHMLLSTETGK
jgi:hypothetical protein